MAKIIMFLRSLTALETVFIYVIYTVETVTCIILCTVPAAAMFEVHYIALQQCNVGNCLRAVVLGTTHQSKYTNAANN